MTPFELLAVAEDAGDQEIKQAYLDKVKAFPPEQHPAQFKMIRDAFELIASERKRLAWRLLQQPYMPLEELMAHGLTPGTPRRPSLSLFRQALTESLKQ